MWADTAISINFGGDNSFKAYSTKAMVLDSLGRGDEAATVIKKALPLASEGELYRYGRAFTVQKKGKEALDIFKMNYAKHPDDFMSNIGMARGYSATGDYKKAITFAQKAEAQAPNQATKDFIDKMIKQLQDGKDVN